MRAHRIALSVLFLASAIWAQATTITLTGNLTNFQAQSSDPAQFAGLSPIAIGNPYSLKLVFNDALFSVPVSGAGSNMANALQLFELSVNGIVLVTMSNIDVSFFNDVGGRDTLYIQDNAPMTVNGMSPSTEGGTLALQIHDSSHSALQFGQSPDFGKFFDHATDGFGMGVGFYNTNPYSDSFSILQLGANGVPTLVAPEAPAVPDTGASLAFLITGLMAIGLFKKSRR